MSSTTPDTAARAHLEALLGELFVAGELRRWLGVGPEGETVTLELPVHPDSTRELIHAAVGVLQRRALIDVAFFDRLRAEFPAQAPKIRQVCGMWITTRPPGDACPDIALEDSSRALAEALEEAYLRREECIIRGLDSVAVDREILELRRELRRGPTLKAGESLLAGRYRLIEPVGSGGFATVWKGYDRELRRVVAIKLLHHQWSAEPGYRARFLRGARAMHGLGHPAIVKVLREVVEDDGFVFYVMEYIDGPNFHAAVLRGALSDEAVVRACRTIVDALEHAHAQGIVHRDVKPSNILVDAAGRPFLTDFDLLKSDLTTAGTRTGAGVGTLLFSAPETLSDASRVDSRADVYSMGVTLLFGLLRRELTIDDMYEMADLIDGLPADGGIKQALRRATARKVDRRFASVRALGDALDETLQAQTALGGTVELVPGHFRARLSSYLRAPARPWSDVYAGHGNHRVIVSNTPWAELEADVLINLMNPRAPEFGPECAELCAAAGPELVADLERLRECATGVTEGLGSTVPGKLRTARVTHYYIGDDFFGSTYDSRRYFMVHVIVRTLNLAAGRGARSVAFPLLSPGGSWFPWRSCLMEMFYAILESGRALGDAIERVHIRVPPARAAASLAAEDEPTPRAPCAARWDRSSPSSGRGPAASARGSADAIGRSRGSARCRGRRASRRGARGPRPAGGLPATHAAHLRRALDLGGST